MRARRPIRLKRSSNSSASMRLPGQEYRICPSAHRNGSSPRGPKTRKSSSIDLTEPHMIGATVRQIQRKLKEKTFISGRIDGDFGPSTHAAVVSFQASRGLLVDGE